MSKKRGFYSWLKKHSTGLAAGGVVSAFLVTRLYNILAIPMFNDEAIYLRWAHRVNNDWHNLFISLTDGKQPSFIWAESLLLRIFSDPLLAGRLVSVMAGLVTLAGVYFLTKELFSSRKIGLLASIIYVVYPYSLLYDRMALYDSMLSMFAVWSLYLEVLLVKRRQIWLALLTAAVIGGGLLTKSGAIFFIYLIPFSLLLFDFRSKHKYKELLKWLGLVAIVVVGAMVLQSIMRISPEFKYIASKNHEFTLTIGEWIQHPWSYFKSNVQVLNGFVIGYTTVPLLLLALLAFFVDKKYLKEKLLLLAWAALPFIAFACFAKLLYPRYILFMMLPLLPLAAYTSVRIVDKVKIKAVGVIIITLFMLPMVWKDYFIINNFAKAPVPYLDKYAYIEGFFSGVGVKEAVNFIKEQSKDRKVYVGVQGTFGIMPYSLQNYLHNNPNVVIQEFGGIGPEVPTQVLQAAETLPAYFIFRAPCSTCQAIGLPPPSWPVKEIFRVKRIEQNSYFTFTQIVPQ